MLMLILPTMANAFQSENDERMRLMGSVPATSAEKVVAKEQSAKPAASQGACSSEELKALKDNQAKIEKALNALSKKVNSSGSSIDKRLDAAEKKVGETLAGFEQKKKEVLDGFEGEKSEALNALKESKGQALQNIEDAKAALAKSNQEAFAKQDEKIAKVQKDVGSIWWILKWVGGGLILLYVIITVAGIIHEKRRRS
ncbi:MAG: hypothetical protein US63_C0014G0003 [Candidatus Moranbacteria bacterium GW2011_GWC2_37_8]|nr:MAG: hypothetical protein US63_C0014G0003 [Candidatus Moranbacteria bacterium GW2011_GWC2_37_8]KKQ62274.1 MAG: hypothetical protein US82_C0015G0003 [Parcubacteria group bacterium GW2011_GWC1_38_22]KKQ81154.1 MAG: hypothetical protein UT03_C0010G0009 [Candidatus Moranbacteria bacterium GW2011_GWD2_38_7]